MFLAGSASLLAHTYSWDLVHSYILEKGASPICIFSVNWFFAPETWNLNKFTVLMFCFQFLSKDHHLLGMEAPYNSYELSGLEGKLEQLHKDALIIYDFLKLYSREGHTCARVDFVKSELKEMVHVQRFDKAVVFLTRNKIVKVLTIDRTNWIFLHYLYQAEKNIAKYVDRMFRQQLNNRWTLNADFERYVYFSFTFLLIFER